MSEDKFQRILASPKPSKSGGTDQSNAYLFSLAPQATRQWILITLNYFLSHQIPSHWSTSNGFLLFKSGDPLNTKTTSPFPCSIPYSNYCPLTYVTASRIKWEGRESCTLLSMVPSQGYAPATIYYTQKH